MMAFLLKCHRHSTANTSASHCVIPRRLYYSKGYYVYLYKEVEGSTVGRVPARGTQVLKVLGLNPACDTGVLQSACNCKQLGTAIESSSLYPVALVSRLSVR